MLKHIPPILTPELLKVLMEMGHGDEIVIADGNFPGAAIAQRLIRLDGHGVPEILESVSVLRVIEPDYEPENPEAEAYTAYRAALDTAGITPEAISDALEVTLGDMQLSILGAGSTIYEKNADNNNSLVVTVTHCENRFFFAGDIEKQRIKRLLETGMFG